jgi:hypothetical protein
MTINGENVTDTNEGRKMILDYLKDAPDLANFDYKPWNDEQRNKVMNIISQYSSPGSSIETLTRPAPKAAAKPAPAPKAPVMEDEDNEVFESEETPKQSGDDFDDFINGLDL